MAVKRHHYEDRALLDRIRQHDRQAIKLLFDRYSGVVYSVALRVLLDPVLAERAMSDIFMEIWRDPGGLMQIRGSLSASMVIIARNWAVGPTLPLKEIDFAPPCSIANQRQWNLSAEEARIIVDAIPLKRRMQLERAFFSDDIQTKSASRTSSP